MEDEDEAKNAIAHVNGYKLDGVSIRVEVNGGENGFPI